MNKLYKIGGIILGVGLIIFAISFCLSGFDIKKLDTHPAYKKNKMEISSSADSITIDDNVSVIINNSPDNKIHVEYYENEKEHYQINKGKHISFTKTVDYNWYDYFYNMNLEDVKLYIQLPNSFKGNLKINTSNNEIELKNISSNNLELSTSNGNIDLHSINVSQNIKATSSNGNIKLNSINSNTITTTTSNGKINLLNSVAKDSIFADSSNGKIQLLSASVGNELNLQSSNGNISGSICGERDDFSITSHCSNGKNNLPENSSGGSKVLYVSSSNGKIDIQFSDII